MMNGRKRRLQDGFQCNYKPFSLLRNCHCKNSPSILKPTEDMIMVKSAYSEADKIKCNSSVKNISFKALYNILFFKQEDKDNKQLTFKQ